MSTPRATTPSKEKAEGPVDEIVFKIVLLGPSEAGKSALVQHIVKYSSSSNKQQSTELTDLFATVGVDFASTVIPINKPMRMHLRLQMHDCGGRPSYAPTDEEFKTILQNANAIICCYDVRNHHSLAKAKEHWLPMVEQLMQSKKSKKSRSGAEADEGGVVSSLDPGCFFLVGLHADQLRRDGEDPHKECGGNPTAGGAPRGDEEDGGVDLSDMELELELDDEDLDPALANPCGFPLNGNPVTRAMLQDVSDSSTFAKNGSVDRQINAKDGKDIKELTQSLCSSLLHGYKKRRNAQLALKEKKKQDAVDARVAALGLAAKAADKDGSVYSPRGDESSSPPQSRRENSRVGAQEETKEGDLDAVPTLNPERRRGKPVKSEGCCDGGCAVS